MFDFSKLEKLLVNKNISQVRLAEMTGLSQTAVNGMVRGRYKSIDSGNLEKIAKALNVSVGYFFNDDTSLTNQTIITTKNETEMTTIGTKSIEELIRQNSVFQQQVSDLLKMQLLNADTINNLSQGLKKKAG